LLQAEPRITLHVLGGGGALPGRLHSKYLLIEGHSNGHWVLTGSHNYNQTSLRRNDETLLKLNNKAIYQQYVKNFEHMREVAPPASWRALVTGNSATIGPLSDFGPYHNCRGDHR
jgi:phosphatidylserine/phosphatidylglycerophosphate/cardiolipin synthase-like enzyme